MESIIQVSFTVGASKSNTDIFPGIFQTFRARNF